MGLISLTQWAEKNNLRPQSARQKAHRGCIPAFKIGRNWVIDEDAPNKDNRIKSGKYIKKKNSALD